MHLRKCLIFNYKILWKPGNFILTKISNLLYFPPAFPSFFLVIEILGIPSWPGLTTISFSFSPLTHHYAEPLKFNLVWINQQSHAAIGYLIEQKPSEIQISPGFWTSICKHMNDSEINRGKKQPVCHWNLPHKIIYIPEESGIGVPLPRTVSS